MRCTSTHLDDSLSRQSFRNPLSRFASLSQLTRWRYTLPPPGCPHCTPSRNPFLRRQKFSQARTRHLAVEELIPPEHPCFRSVVASTLSPFALGLCPQLSAIRAIFPVPAGLPGCPERVHLDLASGCQTSAATIGQPSQFGEHAILLPQLLQTFKNLKMHQPPQLATCNTLATIALCRLSANRHARRARPAPTAVRARHRGPYGPPAGRRYL